MTNLSTENQLDNTRLHSPAEVQAWKEQQAAIAAEKRRKESAAEERKAAEAARAHAPMSDEEYFKQAQKLEAERVERIATRAREAEAKQYAQKALFDALPPRIDLTEATPTALLSKMQELIIKGYRIDLSNIVYFQHGCYCITLNLSEPQAKASKGGK